MKIICLGSSSGGLLALVQFFERMSSDTGWAFVAIQHLQADVPSLTPQILSRITAMAVRVAQDGELVVPNHVYTIKPNTSLTITGGRFCVGKRTETPGRHKPFDRFLKSLAIDCREQAVGVVLSGYDGDGSDGFIAIKEMGGRTYAQDQSATVDEMPEHAMATGCVDFVLNPSQIADQLSHLRSVELIGERTTGPS